jgi:hypothetical protein
MAKTIDKLINFALDVASRIGFASDLLDAVQPGRVQPFWHPLGFIHMRLVAEGNRALRLHLWSGTLAEPTEPLWPVHNHVFALESLVISGSIRDLRYDVKLDDQGDRRLYEVLYDEFGSLRRYLKSSDFADSTVGWKLTKGAKDGQYQAESQAHRHHLAMS